MVCSQHTKGHAADACCNDVAIITVQHLGAAIVFDSSVKQDPVLKVRPGSVIFLQGSVPRVCHDHPELYQNCQ